ncbi:MAG: efflux RND transporter periplasmic adaptor subunit [Leptolyngbya sp. SIO1E4]|nr:efflux RND transporter periplasmic adaptor subunit [Leptolyngbya sp. SIO1E4]
MTSPDFSSSQPLQPIMASDRRSGPPRWLLAGGLGLLLLGGGFIVWRLMGARGGPPMGMPPGVAVGLEPVQVGQVQDSSEFLGSLEAETGVVLQPEVSGRVTQVFVSSGERVDPGTPIVLISPDRTQAEVNAAQANVTAARAARDAAAANLRSLQERQAEREAELLLRQEEYDRTATLVEQGALSQQNLDFANRDLDVARAGLTTAQEEIAAAQASLSQSEAALAEASANRAAAQENLQDRTVVAPIAGAVGDLEVKLGEYVTPNNEITRIIENNTLELELEVSIDSRDRLSLGLPVELIAVNGEEVISTGSVTFISPQTDASTQTVLIEAQFENADGRLQDAQRVDARIIWSEQTGVLVPTSAITRLGGQTFVYVAEAGSPEELPPPEAIPPGMSAPDQVARLRPVELGAIQGNSHHVLSGLEPGETIVVSGILNLQDGMPILPQSAESDQTTLEP